MKANSDKSKQSNKATRRVLAGVLCGASVLSLVLSLVMPPISQATANDAQTVFTEEAVTGGGSSSEFAAVGNTSEDAENQNSDETDGGESGSSNSVEQAQSANAASARATATVGPGIYVPTSIGIGTNIGSSTPDPGVATFVGRDMYVGGKPADPSYLTRDNVAGSYAVEAEGLTVVQGKLALNPLKESWPYTDGNNNTSGAGFRFGTVGFGAQFRPSAGSVVLAVAGLSNATSIKEIQVGTSEPASASVGAWNKGAWVGRQKSSHNAEAIGCDYTAAIAGNRTTWMNNADRQSVVKMQGDWSDDGLFMGNDDGASIMSSINGKNYTNFLDSEVKAKISTPLAKLKPTGSCTVDVAEENSNYTIAKYNKDSRATYGLKFDSSIKKFNRKTSYTDVTGNSVSGEVTLVNNEKLITFTGDADDSGKGSSLQVFNLKASDLTNSYKGTIYRGVDFSFNKIPVGASVVVNIIDEEGTPVEFNTGWRFWWNGEEISRGYENGSNDKTKSEYSIAAQSILWNFATAKQVTIRGGMALEGIGGDGKWTDDDPAAAMLGSIVVPNGSFEDHVTTNGRVYVGDDFQMYNPTVAWNFGDIEGDSASVIDMDQERHNFPWSGTYTPDGSAVAWSKVDAADGTKRLAGSEWAIYATENDARKNENRIVSIVDNGTNDSDSTVGTIQYDYLNQKATIGDTSDTNYFTYYIREVKAPEGYQKSDTIYYATMNNTGEKPNYVQGYVDKNGNQVPFENNPTGTIPNTKIITGAVSWTKVVEGDADHTPLAGSEWKLAKLGADGLTEEKSWTVSDQSASSETTWADTDDTNGKFTLAGLLPGTYTLTETQAPFGYELNKNTYKFTVDSTNGSITWKENEQPSIASGTTYISDKCSATSVKIPVTKSVRNTDWPKDDKGKYVPFEFSIEAIGDYAATAPMPEASKISVAPKARETDAAKLNNITATFGAMTFNKSHLSDAPGEAGDYARTYTYTVKEVEPTTGAIDKLRYSKAEYQVAVTVKAVMNETTGKYTGLTTSTTVTQMKDDMGNTLGENGQGVAVQTSAGADPTIIPVSTFTNTYSTSLPLSGMSGVTLTYLAGAAVLCAAAAWMHIRRKANAKGGERRE
ncbi:MAG: SpaA isopeptide-forming pilin-related protein [Collinsella sp.]|nr:SpaA isopeptide-forming pilin-related protein [Collinsella sp.]